MTSRAAPRMVLCPNCGKPVTWSPQSRYRPFCSERCKLIDLGQWAEERFRIPVEDAADDDTPERSP